MSSQVLLESIQELSLEYCEEIDHTRSNVKMYSIISDDQKLTIVHFFNNPKKCYECYLSKKVDFKYHGIDIDLYDNHLLEVSNRNEYSCVIDIFVDTRQLKKLTLQQVIKFIIKWIKTEPKLP